MGFCIVYCLINAFSFDLKRGFSFLKEWGLGFPIWLLNMGSMLVVWIVLDCLGIGFEFSLDFFFLFYFILKMHSSCFG